MSDMFDNDAKKGSFKKDLEQEGYLSQLNKELEKAGLDINPPSTPIILIMGNPRSGSTFLLQWLAASGIFSYPSNFIARFYANPYIGILADKAIFETGEYSLNSAKWGFSSNLGRTEGIRAPSEFWYFWRHFFPLAKKNILSDEELSSVDSKRFLNQIGSFWQLTGKPLVMKGLIMNWHIPFLYKLYPKFIFIHLERDPFFNAQSLYFARKQYFGDEKKWYSLKPVEYDQLKDKSPLDQVAGQVSGINKAVEYGMDLIPESNKIRLGYEHFCQNPNELIDSLQLKFKQLGFTLDTSNINKGIIKKYKVSNEIKLEKHLLSQLRKYVNRYNH